MARGVRGSVRLAAVLGTVAVVASGGVTVVPTIGAQAAPIRVVRTEADAVAKAAQTSDAVEIPDRTTPTTQTFANPDGSLTAKLSNAPVRVRRAGVWHDIDPTLEFRADGSVGPKATMSEVSLSGGGLSALAEVGLSNGSLQLKAPWNLPRPTLDGAKATYADVQPGLDIVVEATAEGVSYNLVVKSREAATNPALRSIHFPVTAPGLSIRANRPGGPAYVDKDGRLAVTAGDGVMWDSSQAAPQQKTGTVRSSAQAVEDGPDGAHVAEMDLSGDSTGLTLVPNSGLLTAPSTVYPVVLDPVLTTVSRTAWAAVWQIYPTTSFYKTTHSLGVGNEDFEQHKIVRSYFQFDTRGFAGKKVLAATLRTYEVHSASCSARSVSVSRTAPISTATTWNNQPAYQLEVGSQSFAHGYNTSCPDAYVEFPVTNSMVDTATKGYGTSTFRLRATDETDEIAWKQFDSTGQLEVNYVSQPAVPTGVGLTDPNLGCDSAATAPNVGARSITLSAVPRLTATDTGARVQVEYELYEGSTLIRTTRMGLDSPGIASPVTMDSRNLRQVTFHFRARTYYPYSSTGALASAYSASCYFKVDLLAPQKPIVTAKYGTEDVQDCADPKTTACPPAVPYGVVITFTFKATSTDVVRQEYWWLNSSSPVSVSGSTVMRPLVPQQEGYNRLFVRSYDAAGHPSETTEFEVNIQGASPPVGDWSFDDAQGSLVAADTATPAHPLTLNGATFGTAGRSGGSLKLDGVDDNAQSASPVVDTSNSFSVSAWVRLTSKKEAVVAAAAGSVGSAFELYYSASANRWVFLRMKTDTASPVVVQALSDQPPVLSAWTHITGVYEEGLGKIQLYVNGRLQAAGNVNYTDPGWKATGPLSIGQGKYNSVYTNRFPGSVDSVQIWQRGLNPQAVAAVANPRKNDEPVVSLAARWPLDNAVQGTDGIWRASDSIYGADLSVSGFGTSADQSTAFVDDIDDAEGRGRVLKFGGSAAEAVSLPRAVVDAEASFSVGVWVKLADPTKPMVIARQTGSGRDAWRLEWQPLDALFGRWVFARAQANSSEDDMAIYSDTLTRASDGWQLLVAQYDPQAKSETNAQPSGVIGLTVNKDATDGGRSAHDAPYRVGDTTVAGKGRATGSEFAGQMDDLRIYLGSLEGPAICKEYPDLDELTCPNAAG
ncbi:LamG domain-containing protein [Kribbella qitaiheensis]|uniref:LamG domain-containing protein n=1 Tax=Kribbella qitaiheensis TaxID=1544730 RepID=A0A7G6X889_9ACTN|nr:LamG-like jellyroll fold domain-containing protein [Kribbella qitaiheensis]QNE22454.1 LamG domain-containing protein [Kribbella qitaiheensis]